MAPHGRIEGRDQLAQRAPAHRQAEHRGVMPAAVA
jgi:hypothetical protein